MENIYTCKQVAERYSVQNSTVLCWIREGKLKAIRFGKSYRVRESALVDFENQMEKEA